MPKTSTQKTKAKPTVNKKVKVVHKIIKKSELKNSFQKVKDQPNFINTLEEEIESHSQQMLSFLLTGKKEAKKEIFGHFNKDKSQKMDIKTPLILVFATDLSGDNELFPREKLFQLLEALMVVNCKVVVIDADQKSDLLHLGELSDHLDKRIVWYNPKQDESPRSKETKEIDRLLSASDIAVVFNTHHNLVKLLMTYGVVIVGENKSELLENYKPNEETGNAFLFDKKDLWSVFASVIRALETFKFPYDWKFIVKRISK